MELGLIVTIPRKLTRKAERDRKKHGGVCSCWYCWPAPLDLQDARSLARLTDRDDEDEERDARHRS